MGMIDRHSDIAVARRLRNEGWIVKAFGKVIGYGHKARRLVLQEGKSYNPRRGMGEDRPWRRVSCCSVRVFGPEVVEHPLEG